MSREKFEAWGCSDVDLRITLESEVYAGIAWAAWKAATESAEVESNARIAALEAERDALAVESAGMKNAFGPGDAVVNFLTIALRHTTYDQIDLDDVTLAFKMSLPDTPATDAFLCEQRAVGAELCVKALVTSDDDDFVDAPNICANVAAQLRAGEVV